MLGSNPTRDSQVRATKMVAGPVDKTTGFFCALLRHHFPRPPIPQKTQPQLVKPFSFRARVDCLSSVIFENHPFRNDVGVILIRVRLPPFC